MPLIRIEHMMFWVQVSATRKGRGQADQVAVALAAVLIPPSRFLGEALDSMAYIPTASSLRWVLVSYSKIFLFLEPVTTQ